MKKIKLFIIIGNLAEGGVSRSFISFVNSLNQTLFDIDVFILSPYGIHQDKIPSYVNVITFDYLNDFFTFRPKNIFNLLQKGFIRCVLLRMLQIVFSQINKGVAAWFLSRALPIISKQYDVALDYGGQHLLYYMVDRIKATRKISYFHNDYSKWDYYYLMDKKYYPKVDHIVTVSKTCEKALQRYFPDLICKISVLENVIPKDEIYFKADQNKVTYRKKKFTLLTLGHLCERKGTSLALKAASILKDRNIDFNWLFVGNSNNIDLENYNHLKETLFLNDCVEFLGIQSNPYPLIKACDVFVLPSKFEGKSIALDEAKVLLKPIVVTNFSTVTDQFENGLNGSICDMNSESLATAIYDLLMSSEISQKYVKNLTKELNEKINPVEIFYHLIEEKV